MGCAKTLPLSGVPQWVLEAGILSMAHTALEGRALYLVLAGLCGGTKGFIGVPWGALEVPVGCGNDLPLLGIISRVLYHSLDSVLVSRLLSDSGSYPLHRTSITYITS